MKYRYLVTLMVLLLARVSLAQPPARIDSSYANSYYKGRMEWFNALGGSPNAIVFLGNSITERGQWGELLPGRIVMNRGIGGDNTFGVLARLDGVLRYVPKKIFLLIGINDIGRGHPVAVTSANYERIIVQIRKASPATELYVQGVLPLNDSLLQAPYLKGRKDSIVSLNRSLRDLASKYKVTFVDLHPLMANESGELKKEYTTDGIHLTPAAYVVWIAELKRKKFL